jgi:hypothetical protein
MLYLLLEIICWPYRALLEFMKNSGVGLSKSEQNTLKFWKLVAFVGGGLLIVVLLLVLFGIL